MITLRVKPLVAAVLVSALATGCAVHRSQAGSMHSMGAMHPEGMASMCKSHAAAATPEQRDAALTAHIRAKHPSMDAAEVERHRRMAEQHCAAMRTR